MQRDRLCLLVAVLAVVVFLLPGPGYAQTTAPSALKPGETCVDVRIGDAQSYACLNQWLEKLVPTRRLSAEQDAPISAGAPAPAVGTFNQAATHERLGNNFGKSAFPQRPPPPVFSSPLMPGR